MSSLSTLEAVLSEHHLDSAMYKASKTPNGIRTRVISVKGRCPRPLNDGGLMLSYLRVLSRKTIWLNQDSNLRLKAYESFALATELLSHFRK